jgi:hypothetical protein
MGRIGGLLGGLEMGVLSIVCHFKVLSSSRTARFWTCGHRGCEVKECEAKAWLINAWKARSRLTRACGDVPLKEVVACFWK